MPSKPRNNSSGDILPLIFMVFLLTIAVFVVVASDPGVKHRTRVPTPAENSAARPLSTTTLVTLVPPDQVSGDHNDAVACPNCKP